MKANLHRFNFMYHRILLQNLELERKIISEENLKDKNFNIEFNTKSFNTFTFKETKMLVDRNNEEIYKDFLEKIIPQTRILFETVKKYIPDPSKISKYIDDLKKINLKLWDIEDGKREAEKNKNFDEKFIQLARDVYKKNDLRAKIKFEINNYLGSNIKEVKSYN